VPTYPRRQSRRNQEDYKGKDSYYSILGQLGKNNNIKIINMLIVNFKKDETSLSCQISLK